jgi:hypothetical protein
VVELWLRGGATDWNAAVPDSDTEPAQPAENSVSS